MPLLGTAGTQRVVRHIGTASWPGRVTLTNKALYFEASGTISYDSAIKHRIPHSQMGGALENYIGSNKAPCCKRDAKDVTATPF
nr:unnamed protein product [Digitaria exilis]